MRGQAVQGSFAGLQAGARPTDGLFLAVFPDMVAAERIAALARHLRQAHALRGQVAAVRRLHVSLHYLGGYAGVPRGVVSAATEALAAVAMPPFDVLFDRAASFRGQARNHPCVIQGGEGVVGLLALHARLGAALRQVGLGRWVRPHCLPHVTLFYDANGIANHPVEPIGWRVREVVLVHSLYGSGRHDHLARRILEG
jgi:2'-5' RNA ligase